MNNLFNIVQLITGMQWVHISVVTTARDLPPPLFEEHHHG
jgi:hypothetical protein